MIFECTNYYLNEYGYSLNVIAFLFELVGLALALFSAYAAKSADLVDKRLAQKVSEVKQTIQINNEAFRRPVYAGFLISFLIALIGFVIGKTELVELAAHLLLFYFVFLACFYTVYRFVIRLIQAFQKISNAPNALVKKIGLGHTPLIGYGILIASFGLTIDAIQVISPFLPNPPAAVCR